MNAARFLVPPTTNVGRRTKATGESIHVQTSRTRSGKPAARHPLLAASMESHQDVPFQNRTSIWPTT